MRYLVLLLLALALITQFALAEEASVAWFTDANVPNSIMSAKPVDALPDASGTILDGVSLTKPVGIDASVLNQQNGMISFWIKPDWNGNDGKNHIILRIGDLKKNGILVEKSSQNMLRFIMAGGGKVTSSRDSVAGWKSGKWHHVVCCWLSNSKNNKPIGIGLWIDKTCVDSVIFGGDTFMNPSTMKDKKVYIGDKSSKAIIDELIIRNDVKSTFGKIPIETVYRDYFNTAPYREVKIDPDTNLLPSDKKVVKDCQKQFGLMAKMEGGDWERITNFDIRYHQWSNFDAKPFISWSTDDSSIAIVDNNILAARRGLVTGIELGKTTLKAQLNRGKAAPLTATYAIEVISCDKPDLDLMYVERYPRYSKDGTKKWVYGGSFLTPEQVTDKNWPDEGETITSVVHYGNFGFQPSPVSKIKFELVSDNNENFIVDSADTVKYTTEVDVESLEPYARASKTFTWTWPKKSQGEHPVFVRVTIDPVNSIDEICEANNQRCELNIAQAFLWRYDEKLYKDTYDAKQINYIGSFSYFDWANGQVDRLSNLLRETVLPTTSPIGIKEAIRVDHYFPQTCKIWDYEPDVWEREVYFDDWFVGMEEWNHSTLDFDPAMDHELTHGLNTPDLYGHPHIIHNVFLKDPNGQPYAGTQLYPAIGSDGTAMATKVGYDQTDMLWLGYITMMDSCHWWLDQYIAGMIHNTAGERRDERRGAEGVLSCPATNKLLVLDIDDKPLKNAAVYAYQILQAPEGLFWDTISTTELIWSKYVPDRPKFVGNTDSNGYWTIPANADEDWDDSQTDEFEGGMKCPQPFHRVKFTHDGPCFFTGGYFILKIVGADNQVEFRTLTQIELWDAYMRGETDTAVYPIKTNLKSAKSPVKIVKPVITDAMRRVNLKPVPVVTSDVKLHKKPNDEGELLYDMYVKPGQSFTLDGTKSYDPEGQPLIYRWLGFGEDYGADSPFSVPPIRKVTAPTEPGEYKYDFYVMDGLRASKIFKITVHVSKDEVAVQE